MGARSNLRFAKKEHHRSSRFVRVESFGRAEKEGKDGDGGAAGLETNPGDGGAKRRDGSEAASPDDDDGARSGRAPRNLSHPAGGMDTMPVEELQAQPLEPSAEVASVNVLLEPYLW